MRKLIRNRHERGFTLIELLIVILIIGILAAVAGPLYIGYTKDAKLAEAKSMAGSIWIALQALAQQHCGVLTDLTEVYSRAGLSATGTTNPVRWDVGPDANATLQSTCANGAYTLLGGPITINGTATDVTDLAVTLDWNTSATPPTELACSTDGGVTFSRC